jgi:hypothetical protein
MQGNDSDPWMSIALDLKELQFSDNNAPDFPSI